MTLQYCGTMLILFGLGLSKVEGSGIPGGEVKFTETRRKADGEGISLALS